MSDHDESTHDIRTSVDEAARTRDVHGVFGGETGARRDDPGGETARHGEAWSGEDAVPPTRMIRPHIDVLVPGIALLDPVVCQDIAHGADGGQGDGVGVGVFDGGDGEVGEGLGDPLGGGRCASAAFGWLWGAVGCARLGGRLGHVRLAGALTGAGSGSGWRVCGGGREVSSWGLLLCPVDGFEDAAFYVAIEIRCDAKATATGCADECYMECEWEEK